MMWMIVSTRLSANRQSNELLIAFTASTVISLADWHHLPAQQAFANKSILAP
jgi:hypothetical protein